jgi:anti-anti-sigma regulatory factor
VDIGREGEIVADPLFSADSDGAVYRDRQLSIDRTHRPPGFRFVGEIDISNSVAIAHALRQTLDGQQNIHFDMRSLVFCDVSGIRALVNVAGAVGGRRLLIHGLPPELERVIGLVGWADQSSLSFCGCAEVQS